MNKKGQTLALFVLLLPIITGLLALFIDCSIALYNKNRISGIITSNLQTALDKDIVDTLKIEEAIKENIDEINMKVNLVDNRLYISTKVNKKNIFGSILDFDLYKLNFEYCGNYLDKNIIKGKEC